MGNRKGSPRKRVAKPQYSGVGSKQKKAFPQPCNAKDDDATRIETQIQSSRDGDGDDEEDGIILEQTQSPTPESILGPRNQGRMNHLPISNGKIGPGHQMTTLIRKRPSQPKDQVVEDLKVGDAGGSNNEDETDVEAGIERIIDAMLDAADSEGEAPPEMEKRIYGCIHNDRGNSKHNHSNFSCTEFPISKK